MMRTNPWNSYRQVATETATPAQLVLMLYDGGIRFLERALTGFAQDDPLAFNETVNNNILRAQAIVNELDCSLDLNAGGELASRLRSLYRYLDRRLQESNARKDPDGIRETISRLSVLRDAWAQMLNSRSDVPTAQPLAAAYA